MTDDDIKQMFQERREAKQRALAALSSTPAEALDDVLNALTIFMEFDEEGVKELLREAIALARGEAAS